MTASDDMPHPDAELRPLLPGWAVIVASLIASAVFALFVQRGWTETSHGSFYYASVHNNRGIVHSEFGRIDEAEKEFREALRLDPTYAEASNNMGNTRLKQGKLDEAVEFFRQAITRRPQFADAHNNLGLALLQKNLLDEAIRHLQAAVEIKAEFADAHNNLGYALLQKGRLEEALEHFQICVGYNPGIAQAHHNGAIVSFQLGRTEVALGFYQMAIDANPQQLISLNNLAWLLATLPDETLRNGAKAVMLGERASQLSGGGDPVVQRTLAAAYAEAGRFSEASSTARLAFELAQASGNTDLAAAIRSQMEYYADAKPYREPAPAPPAAK